MVIHSQRLPYSFDKGTDGALAARYLLTVNGDKIWKLK